MCFTLTITTTVIKPSATAPASPSASASGIGCSVSWGSAHHAETLSMLCLNKSILLRLSVLVTELSRLAQTFTKKKPQCGQVNRGTQSDNNSGEITPDTFPTVPRELG